MSNHEKRILTALLTNLRAAGFAPAAVFNRDGYLMVKKGKVEEIDGKRERVERSLTDAEVLQIFAEYDMWCPTIHFTDAHLTTWGKGVMVVEGNEQDFIADWHCGDKAFDAIVNEVASAAGDGVYS